MRTAANVTAISGRYYLHSYGGRTSAMVGVIVDLFLHCGRTIAKATAAAGLGIKIPFFLTKKYI